MVRDGVPLGHVSDRSAAGEPGATPVDSRGRPDAGALPRPRRSPAAGRRPVDAAAVRLVTGTAQADQHPHRQRPLGACAAVHLRYGRQHPAGVRLLGLRAAVLRPDVPDPVCERAGQHRHRADARQRGRPRAPQPRPGPRRLGAAEGDVPARRRTRAAAQPADPGSASADRPGRRLRPLREEGVLVVGSGFLTHGLPFLTREDFTGARPAPGWSRDFDAWAADALDRGDVETLASYRDAPGMPYAHPTVEHYTPLFVTLGAAADPEATPATTIDGFAMGLSKRSIQVA